MRTAVGIIFLVGAIALLGKAAAATSCSFIAGYPAPMSFGNYDPTSGSSVTATTTIQYKCGHPLPANVTMTADAGTTAGATVTNREMLGQNLGDKLPYTLSLSASHAPIFGDGTGGTQTYSATISTTSTVTVTIYGIINAAIAGGAGDVRADTYRDTVTITMTF
jgi:spore coat protein U-like protein